MIIPTITKDSVSGMLVQIIHTGALKPVVGTITNPYMDVGWMLNDGTGIYGPHKRRITIRAKGGGWLKFPPRDKYKGPGKFKSGVSGIGHLGRDNAGQMMVFAKVTHPKGIKPKRFVERAVKQAVTLKPTVWEDVLAILNREGAAKMITTYCERTCKALRSKTAGLGGGKLSRSFTFTVR